jgi:hypothetical protein
MEGRGGLTMRSKAVVALVTTLVMVALVTALSIAASPRSYQYTGIVTEIDAKNKFMRVDKSGEIWEFSTAGMKELKAKKGDKVTVYYEMIAKKVEVK